MSLIYIADGQRTSRMVLERLVPLLPMPCASRTFDSADALLDALSHEPPDLLLIDPSTCAVDAPAFAKTLRSLTDIEQLPVIFVIGEELFSVRGRILDAGGTDCLSKPVCVPEFKSRCSHLLQLREQQHQLQDRTAWLSRKIEDATSEIRAREEETLLRLARAGEYRDEETGLHVLRMARYSRLLAERMGLSDQECVIIERAAPMHDIGKIGVSDLILQKAARLTVRERRTLQRHTQIGYEILKGSPSQFLQTGAVIALAHHEKFDGSGYPGGLSGEDIPLTARIVAVADVYDALTTPRPYKEPWSIQDALDHLREQRGMHFDPRCVDAFLAVVDDVVRIQAALADEPSLFPYLFCP